MLACYSCFFEGLDGQLDPNIMHEGCEVMLEEVSYKIDGWERGNIVILC
jgi:hypothetical protein